mmetsp:Transcript_24914/g.33023  ORF Transcript_24914/g.33023 Transcript_24914/m.33023 type:complete len:84 (+) Transcript_24914:645-896(+)|eukprot:7485530-Ditylum_brightwellii.AAC.1
MMLANQLLAVGDLPVACQAHPEVVNTLRRKNTKSDPNSAAQAFAGMSAGEQQAAMAQRSKGQMSHAQIQRRLTSTRRFTKLQK